MKEESCIDVYTYIQIHTQHTPTTNNKGSTNLVYYDKAVWTSLQLIAKELGTDVSHLLWPIITKIVAIHDGRKNGMDRFLDPNFIPVPPINDDFETKILPWLRTLNDEDLNKAVRNLNQGRIYAQALLDTPIEERRNVGFDYPTIWRQYRG